MTAEQSIVGAMGCASWRSHYRLREHAALAPIAGIIRGDTSLRIERPDSTDLNEVGVTDMVLAAIWRFGPDGAAYAISSHAEGKHLCADIAIVHLSTSRILLYQAKLASHHSGVYSLKSPVTKQQLALLGRRRPIEIQGTMYQMTGRLALYQQDLTPHLRQCPPPFGVGQWPVFWWGGAGPFPVAAGGIWEPSPEIGRMYYDTFLAGRGCSPSGILAALVPGGRDRITSVAVNSTWPWEFDAYEWFREATQADGPTQAGADRGFGGSAPDFGSYGPEFEELRPSDQVAGTARERVADIASELADKLRLPTSIRLYVIALP
jgi:hypothetical protein